MRHVKILLAGACAFALSACGDNSHLDKAASYGPHPELIQPQQEWFPTYQIPKVVGWKPGETPTPAPGLKVSAFAQKLQHPRWLYVLPNGDVLVAEANRRAQTADLMGYGGLAESVVRYVQDIPMKNPNRILLLRDSKGAGKADIITDFITTGLDSPIGMTLVGDTLYVADTNTLWAYPYHDGDTRIDAAPRKVTDLPGGDIDHHWTKNVIASKDGSKLYVTVGSNSNAGENGLAAEKDRAAIWEVDPKTGAHRIYAGGIRNPNGMGWASDGKLWVTVNERDELGGDLVPDYMTSVRDGGFYGWPYSYYGQHIDARVKDQNPALVARAIPPDYALGTHTASLGLTFADGAKLPAQFSDGVFIGQHGSWNRRPLNGYRLAFIKFTDGKPVGMPTDVLTGFLNDKEEARGRPVDVTIAKDGALLVADDGGNVIWRVTSQ